VADDLAQDDLLDRLDGMLANLQQHIDQRAQEIAQPLIAKAQQDAEAQVDRAQGRQRRAEDVVTELRRQIRVLESSREDQRRRAVKAEEANTRVRRLCECVVLVADHPQAVDQAREILAALDSCEV
jgi:DNA helicase IV